MISLTRRYRFPASHRLHSPALSKDENARVYGKCNNPYGHGHDYTLELTVIGDLDPITGLLLPITRLDRFVNENILRLFSYRNINVDVPQFSTLVPTTENIAGVIAELILRHWPQVFGDLSVRPSRIHLRETDRNGFEIRLSALKNDNLSAERNESVLVHA